MERPDTAPRRGGEDAWWETVYTGPHDDVPDTPDADSRPGTVDDWFASALHLIGDGPAAAEPTSSAQAEAEPGAEPEAGAGAGAGESAARRGGSSRFLGVGVADSAPSGTDDGERFPGLRAESATEAAADLDDYYADLSSSSAAPAGAGAPEEPGAASTPGRDAWTEVFGAWPLPKRGGSGPAEDAPGGPSGSSDTAPRYGLFGGEGDQGDEGDDAAPGAEDAPGGEAWRQVFGTRPLRPGVVRRGGEPESADTSEQSASSPAPEPEVPPRSVRRAAAAAGEDVEVDLELDDGGLGLPAWDRIADPTFRRTPQADRPASTPPATPAVPPLPPYAPTVPATPATPPAPPASPTAAVGERETSASPGSGWAAAADMLGVPRSANPGPAPQPDPEPEPEAEPEELGVYATADDSDVDVDDDPTVPHLPGPPDVPRPSVLPSVPDTGDADVDVDDDPTVPHLTEAPRLPRPSVEGGDGGRRGAAGPRPPVMPQVAGWGNAARRSGVPGTSGAAEGPGAGRVEGERAEAGRADPVTTRPPVIPQVTGLGDALRRPTPPPAPRDAEQAGSSEEQAEQGWAARLTPGAPASGGRPPVERFTLDPEPDADSGPDVGAAGPTPVPSAEASAEPTAPAAPEPPVTSGSGDDAADEPAVFTGDVPRTPWVPRQVSVRRGEMTDSGSPRPVEDVADLSLPLPPHLMPRPPQPPASDSRSREEAPTSSPWPSDSDSPSSELPSSRPDAEADTDADMGEGSLWASSGHKASRPNPPDSEPASASDGDADPWAASSGADAAAGPEAGAGAREVPPHAASPASNWPGDESGSALGGATTSSADAAAGPGVGEGAREVSPSSEPAVSNWPDGEPGSAFGGIAASTGADAAAGPEVGEAAREVPPRSASAELNSASGKAGYDSGRGPADSGPATLPDSTAADAGGWDFGANAERGAADAGVNAPGDGGGSGERDGAAPGASASRPLGDVNQLDPGASSEPRQTDGRAFVPGTPSVAEDGTPGADSDRAESAGEAGARRAGGLAELFGAGTAVAQETGVGARQPEAPADPARGRGDGVPVRTPTQPDLAKPTTPAPSAPPGPRAGTAAAGPAEPTTYASAPAVDLDSTPLPAADPDWLGALVPDTVVDGARHGTMSVRAASVRGEDARERGFPRTDRTLLARFGGVNDGLLVLVVAAPPDVRPLTDPQAAGDAAQLLAAAVGRNRAELLHDLRDGAQDRLRYGLQRLLARAARDLPPGSSLHALVAPLNPGNRLRAGFGTGPGGLLLLGGDYWYDAYAGRRLGSIRDARRAGAPAADTSASAAAAARPGAGAAAAAEAVDGFRFRAVRPEPGDLMLLCTPGLSAPLTGQPAVSALLGAHWSEPHPPSALDFLRQIQVRAQGHRADRTAVALWEE